MQIEPYRSMADRFNVYALCTASVDGYGGTSTFFAATAEGGISTNKGNWRNHVLERIIGPAFIEKIHDAHIPNETHPNENTMDHNYRQYDYVYEISTNSLCWRIAVSISVALMIINNMVFTILLRQRETHILRLPSGMNWDTVCSIWEMNIIIALFL